MVSATAPPPPPPSASPVVPPRNNSITTQPLRAQAQRHQLSASTHSQALAQSHAFEQRNSLDLGTYPSIQDIQPHPYRDSIDHPVYTEQRRTSSDSYIREPLTSAAPTGWRNRAQSWTFRIHDFVDRFVRSHWDEPSSYDHIEDEHNMQASTSAQPPLHQPQQQQQHARSSSYTPRESLYHQLRWTSSAEPLTRKRKLQLLRSYLPDWIITIVLAGLLAIINKVYGFRREFSLTDTSIQHTYAVHERVPTWLLGVLAVLIPAIIIAVISLGVSRSIWDLHNGLLGFVLAHALTVTITTIIKVTVGRPRPDLIDRCQPFPNSANASPYGLATEQICSVNPSSSIIKDGFRSFPSGHASTSFAGFTYLALYLAGKFHLFDRRGHAVTAWLCVTPLMAAALIAISRTMDYRHHATDVIAGGLLGLLIAYWVYRLYYPPLSHPQCHKPYSPRIPKEGIPVGHQRNLSQDSEVEYGDVLPNQGTTYGGPGRPVYSSAFVNPDDVNGRGARHSLNIQDPNGISGPTKDLGHSLDYPDRETVPREAV